MLERNDDNKLIIFVTTIQKDDGNIHATVTKRSYTPTVDENIDNQEPRDEPCAVGANTNY